MWRDVAAGDRRHRDGFSRSTRSWSRSWSRSRCAVVIVLSTIAIALQAEATHTTHVHYADLLQGVPLADVAPSSDAQSSLVATLSPTPELTFQSGGHGHADLSHLNSAGADWTNGVVGTGRIYNIASADRTHAVIGADRTHAVIGGDGVGVNKGVGADRIHEVIGANGRTDANDTDRIFEVTDTDRMFEVTDTDRMFEVADIDGIFEVADTDGGTYEDMSLVSENFLRTSLELECGIQTVLADLESAMALHSETFSMNLVASLSQHLANVRFNVSPNLDAAACSTRGTTRKTRFMSPAAAGPELRRDLLEMLDELRREDKIHLRHAQQLGLSLASLSHSQSSTPLTAREVDVTLELAQLLATFSQRLVEQGDVSQARVATRHLALTLGNVLAALDSSTPGSSASSSSASSSSASTSSASTSSAPQCRSIRSVRSLLRSLFELELGPLLLRSAPGEVPTAVAAASASSLFADSAVRSHATENGITLTAGGSGEANSPLISVDIAVHSPLSVGGTGVGVGVGVGVGALSLAVVTIDSAPLRECFADAAGAVPLSAVVMIELGDDVRGKITTDLEVDFELMYSLPADSESLTVSDGDVWYAAKAVEEPEMLCGFINETTEMWSTDGCDVVEHTIIDSTRGMLRCRCDHLTTFAVIRGVEDDPRAESMFPNGAVYGFLAAYTFIGAFTLLLIRAFHVNYQPPAKRSRGKSALHYKAILTLCLSQCLCQVLFLSLYEQRASLPALALFSSLARVLSYWLFATMIYQWSMLASRHMSPKGVRKTRLLCMYSVVAVTSVLVVSALVYPMLPEGSRQAELMFTGGSLLMFAFNFATFVGLAVSASILLHKVNVSSKQSGLAENATARAAGSRLFRLAFAFCTVFFIESVIILISGVAYDFFVRHFLALQSVYLISNIFSIAVVVLTTRSTLVLHMSKKREQRENDRLPDRARTAVFDLAEDVTSAGTSAGGTSPNHRGESFAAHLSMLQQAAQRYFLYAPPPKSSFGFSTTRSVSDFNSGAETSFSDTGGYRGSGGGGGGGQLQVPTPAGTGHTAGTGSRYAHSEFSQSEYSRSKSSLARVATQVRTSVDRRSSTDSAAAGGDRSSDTPPLRIPLPSIVAARVDADVPPPQTSPTAGGQKGHPLTTAPPPLENFSGRPAPDTVSIAVQMATFPAPASQPPTLLEEEVKYHDNGVEFSPVFRPQSRRAQLQAVTFEDPNSHGSTESPGSRTHPHTYTIPMSTNNRTKFPQRPLLRPSRSNPTLRPSTLPRTRPPPSLKRGSSSRTLTTPSTSPNTITTPGTSLGTPTTPSTSHKTPGHTRSPATLPRPLSPSIVAGPKPPPPKRHARAALTLPREFSPSLIRREVHSGATTTPTTPPSPQASASSHPPAEGSYRVV